MKTGRSSRNDARVKQVRIDDSGRAASSAGRLSRKKGSDVKHEGQRLN